MAGNSTTMVLSTKEQKCQLNPSASIFIVNGTTPKPLRRGKGLRPRASIFFPVPGTQGLNPRASIFVPTPGAQVNQPTNSLYTLDPSASAFTPPSQAPSNPGNRKLVKCMVYEPSHQQVYTYEYLRHQGYSVDVARFYAGWAVPENVRSVLQTQPRIYVPVISHLREKERALRIAVLQDLRFNYEFARDVADQRVRMAEGARVAGEIHCQAAARSLPRYPDSAAETLETDLSDSGAAYRTRGYPWRCSHSSSCPTSPTRLSSSEAESSYHHSCPTTPDSASFSEHRQKVW